MNLNPWHMTILRFMFCSSAQLTVITQCWHINWLVNTYFCLATLILCTVYSTKYVLIPRGMWLMAWQWLRSASFRTACQDPPDSPVTPWQSWLTDLNFVWIEILHLVEKSADLGCFYLPLGISQPHLYSIHVGISSANFISPHFLHFISQTHFSSCLIS
jgi:hypothetical protein